MQLHNENIKICKLKPRVIRFKTRIILYEYIHIYRIII